MALPFTHSVFLDVFGAYNAALWPAVVVLWLGTVVMTWRWLHTGRVDGRGALGLLAVHWAWSGIAYHWGFFRGINPAATLFGALFVLQAAIFAWLAISSRAQFTVGPGARGVASGALVVYGLAYPLLGLAFGLRYPRLPVFAVPCPTTLVTTGLLLASTGVPRLARLVPILWAVIGGSAAFVLGIRADLALVVAALLLALDSLMPSALGPRATA